eukprot:COSAG05_NODE_611_length_8359_cov_5.328935_10_plen_49_part_00
MNTWFLVCGLILIHHTTDSVKAASNHVRLRLSTTHIRVRFQIIGNARI